MKKKLTLFSCLLVLLVSATCYSLSFEDHYSGHTTIESKVVDTWIMVDVGSLFIDLQYSENQPRRDEMSRWTSNEFHDLIAKRIARISRSYTAKSVDARLISDLLVGDYGTEEYARRLAIFGYSLLFSDIKIDDQTMGILYRILLVSAETLGEEKMIMIASFVRQRMLSTVGRSNLETIRSVGIDVAALESLRVPNGGNN